MLNNLSQIRLKLLQKQPFKKKKEKERKKKKKKAGTTGDLIRNEIVNKIIQKQLQMRIIQNYLKKDMYLQKSLMN